MRVVFTGAEARPSQGNRLFIRLSFPSNIVPAYFSLIPFPPPRPQALRASQPGEDAEE